MRIKNYLLSLLLAVCGPSAWALSVDVYDDLAYFEQVGDSSLIEMLGFGRGGSNVAFGASAAKIYPANDSRENFFDTWNVDTSQVAAGEYFLDSFVIDVAGSLQLTSVVFNSYDPSSSSLPVLRSVLFEVNAAGTQAKGSGTFTVMAECPVASCVFIQVFGTQAVGDVTEGYGRDNIFVATPVPEPAAWALLALGLGVVGGAARRARA